MAIGIFFLAASLLNFLEGSPSSLSDSIVGLLFLFAGISKDTTFLDKNSYTGLLVLIIVIGSLIMSVYVFKPAFVNDPSFYISLIMLIFLIIWTPFIYRRAKKYQKAVEPYEEALKINNNDINALNSKCSILAEFKAYNDAVKCFDKVLKIDPQNFEALYNVGNLLSKKKIYQTAAEYYERALDLDPNNANTWYNKGNALQELGKSDEALECYKKVLELEPDFEFTKKAKGVLKINE